MSAPAAMIQVAVFEDMKVNPSGGQEKRLLPDHR
jgi:hypothetical protein